MFSREGETTDFRGSHTQGNVHLHGGYLGNTFDLGAPTEGVTHSMSPLQAFSPNLPLLSFGGPSPSAKPVSASQPTSPNIHQRPKTGNLNLSFGSFPLFSPGLLGDLADDSKLGDLPSADDLLFNFLDPAMPQPTLDSLPLPPPIVTFDNTNNSAQDPVLPGNTLPQPSMGMAGVWVPLSTAGAGFSLPQQQPHQSFPGGISYMNTTAAAAPFEGFNPGYELGIGAVHEYDNPTPRSTRERLKRSGSTLGAESYPDARRQRTTALYSWGEEEEEDQDEEAEEEAEEDESSEEARPQRIHQLYAPGRPSAVARRPAPRPSKTAAAAADPEANTGQTFRGVSRHRLTQRWEASLWLAGRQLYLGGFDSQIDAAKAYDLAALACKGREAVINFPVAEYESQLLEIQGFSREEVVAYVRRRSAAFSRGRSRYRGVSGHNGRWEARIGSFSGRKNVSFGVFDSEEGAARQYDRALILEKGRSAKTNFPLRDYEVEVLQYKTYMTTVCGDLRGGALAREVAAYTLPRNRVATADEKKRSAVIYGESLRRALEGAQV